MSDPSVRELVHRDAIRELYSAYCFFVDHGRADLFANAFTPDGVMWLSDRGSFDGREEIEAHVQKRSGKTLHLIHNVTILRIEEPWAWSHAYFQLLEPETGGCASYGYYDDVAKLEPDGNWYWHVKKTIYQFQTPAYSTGVALRPDFGLAFDRAPTFLDNLSIAAAGTQ